MGRNAERYFCGCERNTGPMQSEAGWLSEVQHLQTPLVSLVVAKTLPWYLKKKTKILVEKSFTQPLSANSSVNESSHKPIHIMFYLSLISNPSQVNEEKS